jgi:hypothetical protein
MARGSVELESHSHNFVENSQTRSIDPPAEESVGYQVPESSQSLERTDSGSSAWKLLVAAFMMGEGNRSASEVEGILRKTGSFGISIFASWACCVY